jgi:glutathione S-transferase
MMELYHWEPVSHSARVMICLREAGADYKAHYVDLLEFEQFSEEFLGVNKAGQVPALVTDGVVLTESSLITEYIAERYPGAGLAPTDAKGWYDTQTWSKWVDYNLSSSLATLATRKYLAPHLATMDADDIEKAVAKIPVAERRPGWEMASANDYSDEVVANSRRKVRLVIERMEKILESKLWLVGENYSIADINTYAMVVSLQDVAPDDINAGKSPNTMRWLKRIDARPAVSDTLADFRKHATGTMFAPGPEHSRWG